MAVVGAGDHRRLRVALEEELLKAACNRIQSTQWHATMFDEDWV